MWMWAAWANAAPPIGFDFWNHLGTNEGLSQNEVHCILQDHRGLMWFGTQDGLNCYDGQRVQVFRQTPFDSTSLSDDFITTLHEDSKQRFWVGTAKGLNCYDFAKGTFRRSSQLKTVILQIIEDKNKTIWVQTKTTWWVMTANETEFKATKRSPDDAKKALLAQITPLLPTKVSVSSLITDHLGIVWVGTRGQGIYRFRYEADKQQYAPLDAFDEDFFDTNGLKSSHITCLYEGNEADEDIVWIGTREAGVQLYSRSKNTFKHWERLFTQESAATRTFFGLTTDKKGHLWVGSYSGLYRIHRATHDIRTYKTPPNTIVETSLEDAQGSFWVGGNTGLFHLDNAQQQFETFNLPLYEGHQPWVLRIYEDPSQQVWVGTRGYLAQIDPQKKIRTWKELPVSKTSKAKLESVGTIQRDAKGGMWIGMRQGLIYWPSPNQYARLFQNNPNDATSLISNMILDVHVDAKQRVWICSAKGLSLAKHQNGKVEFEHFTEKNGLTNSFVYGAMSDKAGHLWLTTNGGLIRFNPEKKTFRTYTSQDGLGGLEFNSGGFHRSPDGEFFVGGNGMLLSFRPDELVINKHLPRILLRSFKKFEKPVVHLDSIMASGQPIRLDYDENFFSFEWAALDYTNPSSNQFAYRLEGFDKDWVYTGTRRFVDFTNLNPGNYKLWVKAANNEGKWNDRDYLQLSLVITPPFWKTWWFYGLLFLLVAAVAKLLYDNHVRQLLALERAKLEENERVRKLAAQDLHDEFGNTLTRISLLTELVKNRMNGQAGGEVGELLTKISDNANRMYQGTKDFIWAINPEHDSLYEIAVRLKDFGDDVFDKTGIRFNVEGLNDSLRGVNLPTGASRHLVLLFKEAMSNTLKHAQATDTTLSFVPTSDSLRIEWQDNGRGMDLGRSRPGNGLMNIQTRAEKIGGKATLTSPKHGGFSVLFERPCA